MTEHSKRYCIYLLFTITVSISVMWSWYVWFSYLFQLHVIISPFCRPSEKRFHDRYCLASQPFLLWIIFSCHCTPAFTEKFQQKWTKKTCITKVKYWPPVASAVTVILIIHTFNIDFLRLHTSLKIRVAWFKPTECIMCEYANCSTGVCTCQVMVCLTDVRSIQPYIMNSTCIKTLQTLNEGLLQYDVCEDPPQINTPALNWSSIYHKAS